MSSKRGGAEIFVSSSEYDGSRPLISPSIVSGVKGVGALKPSLTTQDDLF